MIVYNNQQQLTGHCSFQEDSVHVLLQSPPRNNGNQGQHAIIHNMETTMITMKKAVLLTAVDHIYCYC